ncbi:MAG: SPASM domain-containing protein [Verrucomicrobia bacterium]|nr:SPASM domain-containing protein [Verrucomicrobiota bacterium]
MSVPFAQIEPTTVCNLHCAMCDRHRLETVGHMRLDQFERIISKIHGLQAVKLQGLGEPMLNPDFLPMMEVLRTRGIRAYSVLNATRINANNAEALASVADRIELSIDSADPEQFAAIRKGARLDDVIERVRVLVEARNRRGQFLELSANAVVHTANRAELRALFELISRLGLDRLNLNVVQFWDIGEGDAPAPEGSRVLTTADLDRIRADVESFSWDWSLPARLMTPTAGYENCPWYRGGIYVSWQGDVTPCCQRPDPRTVSFGNLLEQSLDKIWDSDAYRSFRSELTAGRPPEACRSCTMFYPHGQKQWTSYTSRATTTAALSASGPIT